MSRYVVGNSDEGFEDGESSFGPSGCGETGDKLRQNGSVEQWP